MEFMFSLLFTLVAGTLFFFAGLFGNSLCADTEVAKYTSEQGKVILHSMRDCGATTDYVTSLTIDGESEEIIKLKGAHETDLSAIWINENEVEVIYIGNPEVIYSYNEFVDGTVINFKDNEGSLVVKCLYHECEEINKNIEIKEKREWCSYSDENTEYCDAKKPGWESCGESWDCLFLLRQNQ